MMMAIHIKFHHLVYVKWIDSSGDCHAHGVTYKVSSMMVSQERRVARKYGTLFRIFYVTLDGNRTLFARLGEEIKHHLEGVYISLFGKWRALDDAQEAAHELFQDVHWVGGEDGSNRRTANRH